MSLEFSKMHGLGNDYVYVDAYKQDVPDPSRMAVAVSDRHFGIGSDGLVLIAPSKVADCRMIMYNRDGSEGSMCGNAIRCVAKYVYERGRVPKTKMTVETKSGIKSIGLKVEKGKAVTIDVDMGAPDFSPASLPLRWPDQSMIQEAMAIGGRLWRLTCLSMGNPHAVVFVDDVDKVDLEHFGPLFESHDLFPERVNTEFVQVLDEKNLRMRVWERGAGETMACGTGACAAMVAAVKIGHCQSPTTVHLKGGKLKISWRGENRPVQMTGPAQFVFDGHLHPQFLKTMTD